MKRPIINGRDPFGRAFVLDLPAMRRKHAIEDRNRKQEFVTRRKSVPLDCLRVK